VTPESTRLVAIGASAGGIEPLIAIVRQLPADLPAVVLVVVHLPRSGRSALAAILTRRGSLPAEFATHGTPVTPGRIYVARPDHHLGLRDGRIDLHRGPLVNRSRPAIDALFWSVASAPGGPHIAVVLSGSLDDGAAGLRAVLDAGGVGFVQEPGSAMFDSMPTAALERSPDARIARDAEIATLVVEELGRVRETSSTVAALPEEEARMTRPQATTTDLDDIGAVPSEFGCPACGGALWELEKQGGLRFRCRVGHAYAPQSLLDGQGTSVEDGLWVAIRALEEQGTLAQRLADRAKAAGNGGAFERFSEQARTATRHAATIRAILAGEPGSDAAPRTRPNEAQRGEPSAVGGS
jgi:two-component system, chemotaxis family, protein-glutamate methylesterase/glutaminase